MEIPLDYETLRVIWWSLMGTLLIGFALTDGYDLGVASLMPFIGKTDEGAVSLTATCLRLARFGPKVQSVRLQDSATRPVRPSGVRGKSDDRRGGAPG